MSTTPQVNLTGTKIFEPIKIGHVTLENRIVHPPTTRYRCNDDFIPTDSVLEYYSKRAENNGGLLIVEGTFPDYNFGLHANAPMIKTPAQVKSFKQIVDTVHAKGTSIACQFWNLGRAADPKLLKQHGQPFYSASALYIDEASEQQAKEADNEIRAMTKEEIKDMVKEYAAAAKRAVNESGFDFIEIHAAHMYLLDQFIQEASNKRTDEYGGSIENRARFALEVVDACIEAVGADHVGIRLSPYAEFQGGEGIHAKINPIATWGYILSELQKRADAGNQLAYVSLVEPRVSGVVDNPDGAKIDFKWPDLIWKGIILRSGGYLDSANVAKLPEVVNTDDHTIYGFGRYFSSNPDLPNRLRNGYPFVEYDRSLFYNIGTNVGYIGLPNYGDETDHSKDNAQPQALFLD